ncbi:MAG: sigma-54-dependent Fis family transcriptional regulator [Deltaproteobacteria bacterium]|nr:sigma-54-dependent Fis family transcriptional regulator [Deltaproteobacteria bacterium]
MSQQKSVLFVCRPEIVTPMFSEFKKSGVELTMADGVQEALRAIVGRRPDLIVSQAFLPGYRALDLLKALPEDGPPVVVFSEQATAEEARRTMEEGAVDYWSGRPDAERIRLVMPRSEPEPMATASVPSAATGPTRIIGGHLLVRQVLQLARQVARSKATVLISGESGTGKEMFARFLHQQSDRRDGPFVAVNCAALPEHLLESELFGHEKGAFTGAINRKMGKFELASGGTLLLDEISEMDLSLQAKLLRALQEGEIDRVGGTEPVAVDVRVLATTNRDIEESVRNKEFRQDLYYRLNVIPLKLPPLRERGEDIMLLAKYFVDRNCKTYGLNRLELSDEAKSWMLGHDWPGNVRELQNLMERAVLLAGPGPIGPVHFLLDGELPLLDDEPSLGSETSGEGPAGTMEVAEVMPLHEMEKLMILKSLDRTSGNRTQASQLLGISVRTLRNKLNEYRKQGFDVE